MLIFPLVIMLMPEGEERDYMEQLYIQYHRLMLATAWKYTKDKAAVEDIVSDSCLSLMKRIPLLKTFNENALKAYIVTAVGNKAKNHFKKQKCAQKYVAEADAETISAIADRHDCEREISLRQELNIVWAAINCLPEKERQIMRMKYGMEMTDAAIAEQVGLSANSIAKYISRAREKIKEMVYVE